MAAKADDVWVMPAPTELDEEMRAAGGRVAAELGAGDDADTHYYLAASYRQMSLYADAAREAGKATLAATAAENDAKAVAALRLLLTPPLLREDGLAKLGARLTRMRSN